MNTLLTLLFALTLEYNVNLGYIPNINSWVYTIKDENWCKDNNVYVSDLGAKLVLKSFFIGGAVRTYAGLAADTTGWAWFMPMNAYYTFNAGFKYRGLEIKFEHLCHHAVCPTPINKTIAQINGAYNMIGINFKSNVKIFK